MGICTKPLARRTLPRVRREALGSPRKVSAGALVDRKLRFLKQLGTSLRQIVEELLRLTPLFFAVRGDALRDFIWPVREPFQKGVEHDSENYEVTRKATIPTV
jgi:hypothetical protein